MKPPNGKRLLRYLGLDGKPKPGVEAGVVIDDTGLDGPMGRMEWIEGPPGIFARPEPPTPVIWIRFDDATNGVCRMGTQVMPFTHEAVP